MKQPANVNIRRAAARTAALVIAVAVALLLALSRPQPVLASPSPVIQELHVSAVVPPMRHVIINAAGRITEITSNTPEDVTPSVYLYTDTPAAQQALTPAIYQQYRRLLPADRSRAGILYREAPLLNHFAGALRATGSTIPAAGLPASGGPLTTSVNATAF